MNLVKHLSIWKVLLASALLIGVLGGGSAWLKSNHQPPRTPSANCPQPPRNVDPTTLTEQQRLYYGYLPLTPGVTIYLTPGVATSPSQFDRWYQLHGVHYCTDTDQNTNVHN